MRESLPGFTRCEADQVRECRRHGHRTRFFTRDAHEGAYQPGADRVSFVIADCAAPLPLRDGIFERVVCALLADHVPFLDSPMSELARICSHDGFIVLTTVHPTMHLLGVRARFNDPGSGGKVHPKSYDHTLSALVMGAEHAGLHFDEMSRNISSPMSWCALILAPPGRSAGRSCSQ